MSETAIRNALQAHAAGNLAEAERLYSDYLRLHPGHFPTLYALAVVYEQSGNYARAEALTAEAARINPSSPDVFFTRACALQRLGRDAEALFCFDKALSLRPQFPQALVNRAIALLSLKRAPEALNSAEMALALDPQAAGAWNNRGCALDSLGHREEALAAFDKELARDPDNPQVLVNRATVLSGLKRYEESAADYEKAGALAPGIPYLRGDLVHARLHACDWRDLAEQVLRIEDDVAAGERAVVPFVHLVISGSPEAQRKSAEIWVRNECPQAPALWRGERYRHDRIRLGYISADFHAHATMQLAAGLFEEHDRAGFEIIGISLGPDDGSAMRKRLAEGFDRFLDCGARSDLEAARETRRLEIDIAIDLTGHTQHQRVRTLSHRPAPVQAQYLGYPGTMGAPFIDYLIADRTLIPEDERRHYSEEVVYLPDTYQANDRKRAIAESAPTKSEAGLPERGFVFCCFNNPSKIAPDVFAQWMELLREVEGSVLWLLQTNEAAVRNLRREADAAGIAAERLVFAPPVKPELHLARHRLADLFLDTLPYGAHTTASDALWAGLPVVTRRGSAFPGRVASSLLGAAGLAELIAESATGYVALARDVAANPERLAAIRAKLAAAHDTAALFDTTRMARHLESAYRTMWERQQRGEPPASFAVPALP